MAEKINGISLTQSQINQITTAAKQLSTSDSAKVASALKDSVLSTAEIQDLKGIVAISSIISGIESSSKTGTTGTTESIDKDKTIALQTEVKTAQDQYKTLIEKESGLKDDLDEAKSEFEDSRDALSKAVDKMQGAAENASASVNASVNKILADAKAGKINKADAKSKLASISVPSLNGEKLTLGCLQDEVENLSGKISNLSNVYQDVAKVVGDLATKYGSFLETDISTICVNTDGKIVINQPGTEGPQKTGADGIAALDVAKMASMTTEDLAKALDSGAYKEVFDSIKGSGTTALSSTEAAGIIKGLIKSTEGDNSTFGTKGKGADVKILNGISKDDLAAAAKKAQAAKTPPKSCDPYEVTIDGKQYQFLKDNGDGKWDTADIFGINDSKDDIFSSMKTADADKDGKITGEELAKMGIRLVQKEGGKLQTDNIEKDFDLSKVDSIDLKSLKSSNQNDGNTGTFGNFDMKLKDGRSIEGKQTFEELSTLQKLFKGVGNFVSKVATSVKNKFQLDPQTVEFYSKMGKVSTEMSKLEKESTNKTINYADEAIDSSKESISSAKNANVGKDPNENQKKPQEKPVEQKVETTGVKKKKPEES